VGGAGGAYGPTNAGANLRFTNRGPVRPTTKKMNTRFRQAANGKETNCLTEGVHPKKM